MRFGSDPTRPRTAEAAVDLEKLKTLILTPEQYREHPFARKGEEEARSYTYALGNKDRLLTMFGSRHITDSADPLYGKIHAAFAAMQPDLVFVEGMRETLERDFKVGRLTPEETKEIHENLYTATLAKDRGIDVESPEPRHSDEIAHLLEQGFEKRDIAAHTIYRQVNQFRRSHPSASLAACREYLIPYLERFRGDSGWGEEELLAIEQEMLAELDFADLDTYGRLVDPIPWEGKPWSPINEVSGASSAYRDQHILERIAEAMKTHKRLFVVYGASHAVSLEPALRALMKDPGPQGNAS